MEGRKETKAFGLKDINLSHGFSVYGDKHILFTFTSQEAVVKQITRELLWGGVISDGKYKPEEDPYSSKRVTYYVYVKNDNFDDLVNMFRYKYEVMRRIYPKIQEGKRDEEDSCLVTFRKSKVNVTYQKNGELTTASVAQVLEDAYLAAEAMREKKLVINELMKPDDLSLWTEEELLEDKEMAKELENKTQLDKLYVFESSPSSNSESPSFPLLERGINEPDPEGRTYLHYILSNPEFFAAIQFLIDKGADVNKVNGEGNSPLHLAIQQYQKILALLVEHGADLQSENTEGNKPIDLLSNWMERKNIEIKERMQKNPFEFWRKLEKESAKISSCFSSEPSMSVKKRMEH